MESLKTVVLMTNLILENYKVTFPDELTLLLQATNDGWKKYTEVLEEAKNSLEKSKVFKPNYLL
jgi:hypothetical protein